MKNMADTERDKAAFAIGLQSRRKQRYFATSLLILYAWYVTVCAGDCPVYLGYTFLAKKDIPAGQLQSILRVGAALGNRTLAYATACGSTVGCTAFTTGGTLLLTPLQGPCADMAPASNACDGIYVRAALAESGGFSNMTGMEVTSAFDLATPYYSRTSWDDCQRLCLNTPGCRSVSYLFGEQVCRLKSATCLEAQLGVGCIFSGHNSITEVYAQADRITTFDFLAAFWFRAVAYAGITSRLTGHSGAVAACEEAGLRLAPVHRRDALNTLNRAAARAITMGREVNDDGILSSSNPPRPGGFVFWLGARHDSTTGLVAWLDGTRYILDTPPVNVTVPNGCLALTIPSVSQAVALLRNDSAGGSSGPATADPVLAVLPCDLPGVPLCAWYPRGVLVVTKQVDSSIVRMYNNQLTQGDAAAFCNSKDGRLFRPEGVRGRELLYDLTNQSPAANSWIDGFCNGTNCRWSNGTALPLDMVVGSLPQANNVNCLMMANRTTLLNTMPCSTLMAVTCQWEPLSLPLPPGSPDPTLPDMPARIRMHQGDVYAFFTASRNYDEAEHMCNLLGGHLASVHNRETDTMISETWFDLDPATHNFTPYRWVRRYLAYIGGDTMHKDQSVTWTDGSDYIYEGERNGKTFSDSFGCLSVVSMGPGGPAKWEIIESEDCLDDVRLNYTCKLEARPYLQFSAGLVSGGVLYELHDSAPRTYSDAREACQARGGDLASMPDLGKGFDDLTLFVRRYRHEAAGYIAYMGDYFSYLIGAVTNKTAGTLYPGDFYWQDGSPYNWPAWDSSGPVGLPVGSSYAEGTKTAGALSTTSGYTVLSRVRQNHSLPFMCGVPISEPLNTTAVGDGTIYEILSTPYAVTYHVAEQVCQSRDGHLAGVSNPHQLSAVSQLCQQALSSLPSAARGAFASQDISDSCWVGLYCPGGYNADLSFEDGFGERALRLVAADQPSMMAANSTCASTADLVWLDGRGWEGAGPALLGPPSLTSRCGMIRPGINDDSASSLVMAPCKQFATFVCERSSPRFTPRPALEVRPSTTDSATVPSGLQDIPMPSDYVSYQGCYSLAAGGPIAAGSAGADAAAGSGGGGGNVTEFVTAPTPLPVLLSTSVFRLVDCYTLARDAGLPYFGILGNTTSCWGGETPPSLPFHSAAQDSTCYVRCSSVGVSVAAAASAAAAGTTLGARPACSLAGYMTVFRINDTSVFPPQSLLLPRGSSLVADRTAVPYVCLDEQTLAVANASIVAQLHISRAQVPACQALCTRLSACHMYIYNARRGVCVLLDASSAVAATGGLSSLPFYDALWATSTCVKAEYLVTEASLTWTPGVAPPPAATATHICSPGLAARVAAAGGPSLSPSNGLPVADWAACAASCAANATCHAFAVLPELAGNGNSTVLRCVTRAGLVGDRGNEWVASRPWLGLPAFVPAAAGTPNATANSDRGAGGDGDGALGCLVLSRVAPPPPYVCSDREDAAGWELRQLDTADEQVCRSACDADEYCSLYVMYGTPPSCSMRFRTFYNSTFGNMTRGSNFQPRANALSSVRSCVHTYRLLPPHASPAAGRRTRQVRLGKDDAWHTCVPHMDVLGLDVASEDVFSAEVCAQDCSTLPTCSFFITSTDTFPSGVCYQKNDPILFAFYGRPEFPQSSGHHRVDMVTVVDSCFLLDRQLPRRAPSYACARQYSTAFVELRRLPASNAFDCETACNAAPYCAAYTFMDHNGTCVLGRSRTPPSSITTAPTSSATSSPTPRSLPSGVVVASGPAWYASSTCIHVPRLLTGTPTSTTPGPSGQHFHVNALWHYCVEASGSAAAWAEGADGADLLAVTSLAAAGTTGTAVAFDVVKACSRECLATPGCQTFTIAWQSAADASPSCLLRGWTSSAPLARPSAGDGGGGAAAAGAGPQRVCIPVVPAVVHPTSSGGLAHLRPEPAAVQSYRTKQYTLHLTPATRDVAAGVCQGLDGGDSGSGGGQLLSLNSRQEYDVVEAFLKPFLGLRLNPAPEGPLQLPAFWTALIWSNQTTATSGSCTTPGWCYGNQKTSGVTFAQSLFVDAAAATTGCAALLAAEDGSRLAGLVAASCATWSLPFVCEMPAVPSSGSETSYSVRLAVQVFPAATGYADAGAFAAAAGAVLAVLNLSDDPSALAIQQQQQQPQQQQLSLSATGGRRALATAPGDSSLISDGGIHFRSVFEAAAACGVARLQAQGCWLRFVSPSHACATTTNITANGSTLCGVTGVLVVDVSSSLATRAQALVSVLGPDYQSNCTLAIVNSSGSSSNLTHGGPTTFLPVPCSTRAAHLATVTDPDAPLRAARQSNRPPEEATSTGVIVGAVVGSVLGSLLLAAVVAALVVRQRRRRQREEGPSQALPTLAGGPSKDPSSRSKLWLPSIFLAHDPVEPGGGGGGGSVGKGSGEKVGGVGGGAGCVSPVYAGPGPDPLGKLSGQGDDPAATTCDSYTGNGCSSERRGSNSPLSTPLRSPDGAGSGDGAVSNIGAAAVAAAAAAAAAAAGASPAPLHPARCPSGVSLTHAHLVSDAGTNGYMLSSKLMLSTINSASDSGLADRAREAQTVHQLVVTAEDPDHLDVTWQIDPKRDVTWDETDTLGKGTFGVVYRGTYRGQPAAVKTLVRGGQGQYEVEALRSLLHEARILAKVRHPNIVTCYGGCITDTNVFIVEELMSQTLGQLIASRPALLPLEAVLRIGIDVAAGLFQLHPTIVHRDLKPDNVLLDSTGAAKISDFGLARFKLSSYLASTKHLAAGTIPFMAPETLREELRMVSEKADIYSLAVILWAMLTGNPQPWQDYHYAAVLYKVSMRGERPPLPEDAARCPPRLTALINRMWAQEPSARPGAGEVMKHLGVVLRDCRKGSAPGSAVLVGAAGGSGGPGLGRPRSSSSGMYPQPLSMDEQPGSAQRGSALGMGLGALPKQASPLPERPPQQHPQLVDQPQFGGVGGGVVSAARQRGGDGFGCGDAGDGLGWLGQ